MKILPLALLSASILVSSTGGCFADAPPNSATTSAAANSDQRDLEVYSVSDWNFTNGPEFPGAAGTFSVGMDNNRTVGILTYDFTGGGNYVAASKNVTVNAGWSEMRFEVNSDQPDNPVFVRLVDSTDQVHQFNISYTNTGQWQAVRVDLSAPSQNHYAGANDGIIHFPLKQIWLGLGNAKKNSIKGKALFSDISVLK